MYRFRRNVTVTAVESYTGRTQLGAGPTRRVTVLQKYSLDAAVNPSDMPGVNLVTHRMGVGRVTVRQV